MIDNYTTYLEKISTDMLEQITNPKDFLKKEKKFKELLNSKKDPTKKEFEKLTYNQQKIILKKMKKYSD